MSPRVLEALRAARTAGWVLSISSGRPLCLVHKAVLASDVMEYAVCSNGACVVRLSDQAVLSSQLMRKVDALACYELLARWAPAWNCFADGQDYFEWKGASYMLTGRAGAVARARKAQRTSKLQRSLRFVKRAVRFVARLVTNPRHHQVRSILPYLQKTSVGVEKMGCTILDAACCAEAAELLRSDGRFEVVHMGTTELEITARGVTKGTGARMLMRKLGIDPSRAIAFGDGGNDLPLAKSVGTFVAMGNADDDVKAAASAVCPPVAEDGVAVWLERML